MSRIRELLLALLLGCVALTSFEVAAALTAEQMKASPFYLKDARGKYVSHQRESTKLLVADRDKGGIWERFHIEDLGGGQVALRTPLGEYFSADETLGMQVIANRKQVGPWERFQMEATEGGIALKAWNGKYVSADQTQGGRLVANRDVRGPWEVFKVEAFNAFIHNAMPAYDRPFALLTTTLLCIDVEGEKAAAGTRLILWGCKTTVGMLDGMAVPLPAPNQRFRNASGGRISSDLAALNSLCVTHHGRGAAVTLEPCDPNRREQRWGIYSVDTVLMDSLEQWDSHLNFFSDPNIVANSQVRSDDGWCLDVRGGELLAGRELIAWECKTYALNQVLRVQ